MFDDQPPWDNGRYVPTQVVSHRKCVCISYELVASLCRSLSLAQAGSFKKQSSETGYEVKAENWKNIECLKFHRIENKLIWT